MRHFQALAPHVVQKLGLKPNDLVIDVGCNDGTLLQAFAASGMRVLGVDPSERPGRLARGKGVTVFQQFWNHETGKSLRQLGVCPEVITATAVFYHVPDLHDFVRGLTEVMGPNSFFVVQGVNLKDLIEFNEFDHFYHEHSCIHSLGPLTRLFGDHGLRIQDVEFSPIHGGSFILYVCREENPLPTTPAVAEAIAAEAAAGLYERKTYDDFATRIAHNMATLRKLLVLGAMAMLRRARNAEAGLEWVVRLMARRPVKVVAVALANKTARIAFALLSKGETYRNPPAAAV